MNKEVWGSSQLVLVAIAVASLLGIGILLGVIPFNGQAGTRERLAHIQYIEVRGPLDQTPMNATGAKGEDPNAILDSLDGKPDGVCRVFHYAVPVGTYIESLNKSCVAG